MKQRVLANKVPAFVPVSLALALALSMISAVSTQGDGGVFALTAVALLTFALVYLVVQRGRRRQGR
jgi:hypothetical protein